MSPAKKQTPAPTLEPFKIVGKLIGALRDEKGEIVGEREMGDVAIYRPQFGELAELVEKAQAEAGDVS